MKKLVLAVGILIGVVALSACAQTANAPAEFCEGYVATEGVLNTGPEDEENPEPWQEEAVAGLEGLKESAPEAIAGPVAVIADGLVGPIQDFDEEAYFGFTESDEFRTANAAVDQFVAAECGFPTSEITAREYEFLGDLDGIEAGTVGLQFENGGTEVHEMVLFRVNDDVTEPFAELMEMEEEELEGMVTFIAAAFGPPGTTDTVFTELEAGRYGMVCFLPVGATTLEEAETLDAPPHFTQGMLREFTVGA